MFGKLFKKTEPNSWLVEQPGSTMVLLLPNKFLSNDMLNQVFTVEERKKLIAIFESREAFHINMPDHEDGSVPHFHADHLSEGECFFADSNDLNSVPGDVREFEFFANR